MMAKNNLRSVRLSDDTLEAIEAQIGRNFTEKLENMIARCMWELPATEEKLKDLEARIQEKREELIKLEQQIQKLKIFNDMVARLQNSIDRTVKFLES